MWGTNEVGTGNENYTREFRSRTSKKRRRPGRTNTGLVLKYGAKIGYLFENKTFCVRRPFCSAFEIRQSNSK